MHVRNFLFLGPFNLYKFPPINSEIIRDAKDHQCHLVFSLNKNSWLFYFILHWEAKDHNCFFCMSLFYSVLYLCKRFNKSRSENSSKVEETEHRINRQTRKLELMWQTVPTANQYRLQYPSCCVYDPIKQCLLDGRGAINLHHHAAVNLDPKSVDPTTLGAVGQAPSPIHCAEHG